MNRRLAFLTICLTVTLAAKAIAGSALAADVELVVLSPATWDEYAPRGKEVDAIYGDYVLRNADITAVIAKPAASRNANMTVRNVGGAVIDLTERERSNDQLSAFYPGGARFPMHSAESVKVFVDGRLTELHEETVVRGDTIVLEIAGEKLAGAPQFTTRYTLRAGAPNKAQEANRTATATGESHVRALEVSTIYDNPGTETLEVELVDAMRADRTFTFGSDAPTGMYWAYDEWFRQAYGIIAPGFEIRRGGGRGILLNYFHDGKSTVALLPGEKFEFKRRLMPARDLLALKSQANRIQHVNVKPVRVKVHDAAGPVTNAKVSVRQGETTYGWARTADDELDFLLPDGKYRMTIEALGRPAVELAVDTAMQIDSSNAFEIQLAACGYVNAKITDANGRPIPCKVAFHGKSPTASPDFGPDSLAVAVQNLRYSHNGEFRQEIGPGDYEVVISRGPEYDAVFTEITVERGKETALAATLTRSVDTTGWVSADFHSHSSPSGDNTSDQFGRVLNLLAEHIEFAPCTEHNRIDSYTPHLQRIQCERLLATCTGMELTGSPLPINHQNAFPLIHKPRTQDGGAPVTAGDPVVQIERLAMWDNGSEKLVQENHPNLVQILGDKDLDGKFDGGFAKMLQYMDVIEVHPPHGIFQPPKTDATGRLSRNPMFHWLQMLNLGYRFTGVVNTDAHYNFHGSGWLRNYIKCSTDDPAEIETAEVVQASKRGNIVMSNGPFMEVSFHDGKDVDRRVGPGEEIAIGQHRTGVLHIRVQCPNWLDVNRVQVFANGRPSENYTRRTHPELFSNDVVKFEHQQNVEYASDTHLIVAAVGEGLDMSRVMGPGQGKAAPIAVSNPIFVDVDGNGFQPNRDLLDVPIPIQLP